MGKPFKVGAQPARKNPGDQAQRVATNPATTAKKAQDNGETLLETAAGEMTPDFDVESNTPEEGKGDGARPTYPTANPWPEAKPVAHKPFKL